jgi:hypothetical protein
MPAEKYEWLQFDDQLRMILRHESNGSANKMNRAEKLAARQASNFPHIMMVIAKAFPLQCRGAN